MAGAGHLGGDVDHRRRDAARHERAQPLGVVDAVLQVEHERPGVEVRRDLRPAASVSVDLTQNSTSRAPRTAAGSVSAPSGTRSVKVVVSSSSPSRRTASTCAGRPISVTSWPARASSPP